METAILIIASLGLLSSILVFILVSVRTGENYDKIGEVCNLLTEIGGKFDSMVLAMNQIAESKRLSTLLTIEGKKEIEVNPEDFKPKKEELRENMLEILEENLKNYQSKNGKIKQAGTLAYVVLDHSGFDKFVTSEVYTKAKDALTRLLANQDLPSAKRFITTLARNL